MKKFFATIFTLGIMNSPVFAATVAECHSATSKETCPAGCYWSEYNGCQICGIGTYSSSPGSEKCTPCSKISEYNWVPGYTGMETDSCPWELKCPVGYIDTSGAADYLRCFDCPEDYACYETAGITLVGYGAEDRYTVNNSATELTKLQLLEDYGAEKQCVIGKKFKLILNKNTNLEFLGPTYDVSTKFENEYPPRPSSQPPYYPKEYKDCEMYVKFEKATDGTDNVVFISMNGTTTSQQSLCWLPSTKNLKFTGYYHEDYNSSDTNHPYIANMDDKNFTCKGIANLAKPTGSIDFNAAYTTEPTYIYYYKYEDDTNNETSHDRYFVSVAEINDGVTNGTFKFLVNYKLVDDKEENPHPHICNPGRIFDHYICTDDTRATCYDNDGNAEIKIGADLGIPITDGQLKRYLRPVCRDCPVGYYCPPNAKVPIPCPAGTSSAAGSSAVSGCYMNPQYNNTGTKFQDSVGSFYLPSDGPIFHYDQNGQN